MLSFASGSQLAQSRPSGTSAVSVFTASMVTEVTKIVIANTTGSAADAYIFHDDDGSTFDQSTALIYNKSVPANDYITLEAGAIGGGLFVSDGGEIGVQTDTGSALTFTLYGITQDIGQTNGRD
jgi:hypothetical protein